jgi:hypothetical protein
VVADEPDVIEDLREGNAILRIRSSPVVLFQPRELMTIWLLSSGRLQ